MGTIQYNNDETKYLTKRELAVKSIRSAIETGFYQPGQVISQRQIGEDLGLSVTPVREAIIQLSATGIIERHSHHSIKVTEANYEWLRNIYDVRQLLEEEAIKLGFGRMRKTRIGELEDINEKLKSLTDRSLRSTDLLNNITTLDRQFHYIIFSESQNEALVSAIEFIKSSFSVYALWHAPGRLSHSIEEHAQIIGFLKKNDLAGCIRAHRHHLESGLMAAATSVASQGPG